MVHIHRFAIATATLFAFPVNCDLYPKSSAVLSVDNKSYDRLITQSNHTSIVEFYAPWCGHCKNLQPIYENAAKRLKGLVKVAAVNCDRDSNKNLCQRFGIQGYPTLKIVTPGQAIGKSHIDEYNGPRTVKGIYETLVDKIPNFVEVLKENEIEDWVQDSTEKPKAILFTDKSKVSPLYKALAVDFKDSIQFAQLQTSLSAKALNEKYNIQKLPKLISIKDGEKIEHEGELKKENLVEFLSQIAPPNPDPAPESVKSTKSNTNNQKSKDKENVADSSNLKDQKPIVSPEPIPSIPILSDERESANQCLSTKTGTCVLTLAPNSNQKSTEILVKSLSLLVNRYNKQKRVIFPIYILPESNPKFSEVRKALSLEGEANIIAINGKRGWWKSSPKLDFSSLATLETTLEVWISEIQLGQGEKKQLPNNLIAEETEETKDPKAANPLKEDAEPNIKPVDEPKIEEKENSDDTKSETTSTEEVEAEKTKSSIDVEAESQSTEEVKTKETEKTVEIKAEAASIQETESIETDKPVDTQSNVKSSEEVETEKLKDDVEAKSDSAPEVGVDSKLDEKNKHDEL